MIVRKIVAEAKQFATVIGITAVAVAILGGIVLWEYTKWSDCLAEHSLLYCSASLN